MSRSKRNVSILVLATLSAVVLASGLSAGLHPSYSRYYDVDTVPFYEGADYDRSVPMPNDYLKHPVGLYPARYAEVAAYLKILAEASERVQMESHGLTHEDRTLYNLFVSSPENLRNLDAHRAAMSDVANSLSPDNEAEMQDVIASLPAFAWLGYSIHGDELSGTDAAVLLAYHLAAANDSATLHLLDNLIIIIDPCENPDGRERYLSMLQTYGSYVPSWDPQSAQHGGVWPWGRSNHYLFDLNRDWILLTQPETRGRVETIVKYHPVLVVDAHEMGSNATYLFSPPRQPINYNTPWNVGKWYDIYNRDQSAAFDQHGWPYYAGEWNEQWYIGYGSAWPTMHGAVGILYEQAGVDGQTVRQREDYILTYHESVNHQFTSSLANLRTTADNRLEILSDYAAARRDITEQGRQSNLQFLFAPDGDHVKLARFVESLTKQGIAVQRATDPFTVSEVTDIYGRQHSSKEFPEGTIHVTTAQPHGALAKAILEFDLHLKLEFLREERRELEKHGDTRMYEVSAWSLPMAYDLDAYYTTAGFSVRGEPVQGLDPPTGTLVNPDAQFGYIIDMEGELTYRILNRLFQEKLIVHASEKSFTNGGRAFKAGALLLRKRGNPDHLPETLAALAEEIGITAYGVNSGKSTEGSYLGAPTFRLLKEPRLGIFTGAPLSYTSQGSLWFTLDRQLEIPHSLLLMDAFHRRDLAAYNVLVLPSVWGGGLDQQLGKKGARKLEDWVKDGGTLIIVGSSSTWAADTACALSNVRVKRQVLDEMEKYARALDRERQAESPDVDTMALWHPEKVPASKEAEEKPAGKTRPGKDEAQELDRWARRFHPRGTILRADVDTEHWLAFGMKERVPVNVYARHVLVSDNSVKTVARLTPDKDSLRLSGLLWPEARERWAGGAYLTRERKGKGQIIMFAYDPNQRAFWHGTRKMFINAVLYGPGFTRVTSPYGQ